MSDTETDLVTVHVYHWRVGIYSFVNGRKTIKVRTKPASKCPWETLRESSEETFTTFFHPTVIENGWAFRVYDKGGPRKTVEFGWEHKIPDEFLPNITVDFVIMPFKVHRDRTQNVIVGIRETFTGTVYEAMIWKLAR